MKKDRFSDRKNKVDRNFLERGLFYKKIFQKTLKNKK